jgi:hypothetical protein
MLHILRKITVLPVGSETSSSIAIAHRFTLFSDIISALKIEIVCTPL